MSQPEVPAEVDFKIPSWAGKPPAGAHLDVLKGDKLMQVRIEEKKKFYLCFSSFQLARRLLALRRIFTEDIINMNRSKNTDFFNNFFKLLAPVERNKAARFWKKCRLTVVFCPFLKPDEQMLVETITPFVQRLLLLKKLLVLSGSTVPIIYSAKSCSERRFCRTFLFLRK